MHLIASILLVIVVLVVGLVGVLRDLLERAPHGIPNLDAAAPPAQVEFRMAWNPSRFDAADNNKAPAVIKSL
jgi:hypothetical protein